MHLFVILMHSFVFIYPGSASQRLWTVSIAVFWNFKGRQECDKDEK